MAYFIHSNWNEIKAGRFQNYLHQLAELNFLVHPDEIQIQKIEDQDWDAQWRQNLKPIEIGGTFVIKPSWIHLEPPANRKVIEIDPQMAFGTGLHATTQMMLKLLIDHIGAPARIMDMGTGTGILAIAAAQLTTSKIVAFDNDPVAAATARHNCLANQVADKIQLFCGTIDSITDIPFDLILANLNRSIIVESLSRIFRCLGHQGRAIFSGILLEEKKAFIEILRKQNFRLIQEAEQDEWAAFVVSGCQ